MAFRAAGKAGIFNFITGSVPLGLGQTVISGAEGGHEDFYIDTYTAGRDIKSIDLLELMMFSGSLSHSDGQMDKILESLRRKYFPALRAKISSSATDGTS